MARYYLDNDYYDDRPRGGYYGRRAGKPQGRRSEDDISNEDYDREMRYGRSGIAPSLDYTNDYPYRSNRGGNFYEENDYGNSRNRGMNQYATRPRQSGSMYGANYEWENYRPGVYGDRGAYRADRYGGDEDYYPRRRREFRYEPDEDEPDENESQSFRRRFTSNYY